MDFWGEKGQEGKYRRGEEGSNNGEMSCWETQQRGHLSLGGRWPINEATFLVAGGHSLDRGQEGHLSRCELPKLGARNGTGAILEREALHVGNGIEVVERCTSGAHIKQSLNEMGSNFRRYSMFGQG